MRIGPMTPTQVEKAAEKAIPEQVYAIFNRLIVEKWDGKSQATILQANIVELISSVLNISHREVYEKGYLNIEHKYEQVGWIVTYDRPGYNESYPATFTFKKKRDLTKGNRVND